MRYAKIPEQTVRRLPAYLRAVLSWAELGRGHISSDDLARCVGVPSRQVRRDFSYLGVLGTPGVGYPVPGLARQIKKSLRLDAPKKAAQEVIDSLVEAGIQGVLSFAACHVAVPRRVKVINIDIAMDLARLPYYLPSSGSRGV